MTNYGDRSRQSGSAHDSGAETVQRSAGKRSLVEVRYPVQRAATHPAAAPAGAGATSGSAAALPDPFDFDFARDTADRAVQRDGATRDEDPVAVHAAAERGTASASGPLPHGETIQRAFGRHDVSDVQAHTGSAATAAATDMGAQAYATGNHVVFGDTPSLHTAAHEAAHVVQQRGGVQLKSGVGQEGDPYEQHADAVADAVVHGHSAEGLLDGFAGGQGGAGGGAAVARKPADAPVQMVPDADFKKKTPVDEAATNLKTSRTDGSSGKTVGSWVGYILEKLKPAAGPVTETYVSSFDTGKGGFSASRTIPAVPDLVVHGHYTRNGRNAARLNSAQVKWTDTPAGDAPPGPTKLSKNNTTEILGADHGAVAVSAWEANPDAQNQRTEAIKNKESKKKDDDGPELGGLFD